MFLGFEYVSLGVGEKFGQISNSASLVPPPHFCEKLVVEYSDNLKCSMDICFTSSISRDEILE